MILLAGIKFYFNKIWKLDAFINYYLFIEVTVAEEGIRKTVIVDAPSGKGKSDIIFPHLTFYGW